MAEHVLTFTADGLVQAIYSDDIAPVLKALGSTTMVRVSDVEPDGEGWIVTFREWIRNKVICHNLCVLVQSIYELGIEPTFWADSAVAPKVG